MITRKYKYLWKFHAFRFVIQLKYIRYIWGVTQRYRRGPKSWGGTFRSGQDSEGTPGASFRREPESARQALELDWKAKEGLASKHDTPMPLLPLNLVGFYSQRCLVSL